MATFTSNTVAPSAACDDPDACAARILELINEIANCPDERRFQRREMYEESSQLQRALAAEFGRRRGWRLTKRGDFLPLVLARRGCRSRIKEQHVSWRFTDHTYWYRCGRYAAGIATHPFNVDDEYREKAAQWADGIGLTVAFPVDFPTWWYPGATTLVVFTPKATAP